MGSYHFPGQFSLPMGEFVSYKFNVNITVICTVLVLAIQNWPIAYDFCIVCLLSTITKQQALWSIMHDPVCVILQSWPWQRPSVNKRNTPDMDWHSIIWSQLVITQHGGCRSSGDKSHQTINNATATTLILIIFNCFTWYNEDHQ